MTFLKRLWFKLSPRTRDTLARAAKTFVEVFVPAVLLALATPLSLAALWAAVLAAAASAATVAWNTVLKPALPETVVIEVDRPE